MRATQSLSLIRITDPLHLGVLLIIFLSKKTLSLFLLAVGLYNRIREGRRF